MDGCGETSPKGDISHMGEEEISIEFERMLENMNLTEEKKEPLRRIPLNKKREMLTMNSKTVARVSRIQSLLSCHCQLCFSESI